MQFRLSILKPLKLRRIHLDATFYPWKKIKVSLDEIQKPPLSIAPSAVHQFLCLTNFKTGKYLHINAPHPGNLGHLTPGASDAILKSVLATAHTLKADVQVIDYQSLISTLSKIQLRKEGYNYLKNYTPYKLQSSYSPSLYNHFDGEQNGEVEESEDDFFIPRSVGSFNQASQFEFKPTNQFNVKVQLISKTDGKDETMEYEVGKVVLNPESSTKDSTTIVPIEPNENATFYESRYSNQQINTFLNYLNDRIIASYAEDKSKRLILHLRDSTDIVEAENNNSGIKLIHGLKVMINDLQKRLNISVTLVIGSSPALVNEDNLRKDIDYQSQIIDGSPATYQLANGSYEESSLVFDGAIFDSPFDRLHNIFHKVSLFPPSELYLSLRQESVKKSEESAAHLSEKYLDSMEKSMRSRLFNLNSNSIVSECESRGISLFPLEELNVKVEDLLGLNTPISRLAERIWPKEEIARLVALSLGSNLLENPGKQETVITMVDFQKALQNMFETDWTRLSSIVDEIESSQGGVGDLGQPVELAKKSTIATKDSESESLAKEIKKKGIKLNTYEQKILSTVVNPSNLSVGLSDLVLPPSTKLVLQTLITLPLLRPHFFSTGVLSKSSINGVLLFGPPGTGKTMLAKAIAKSSGAKFMNIALSDIFDKYVGEGEKNVRALFTLARKIEGPCVIFLDEVDAMFGTRRSDGSGSTRREIMNEFMSEWDGLMSKNKGIVVLGATNRPFDLDDAILRRMPRRILVDLPNEEAREKILKVHLKGESLAPSVDLKELARKTNHYSGSDLKNLCVGAALNRVKEAIINESFTSEDDQVMPEAEKQSKITQSLSSIDDWGEYISSQQTISDPNMNHVSTLPHLTNSHFEVALAECPPSLSDEMQTLVDLRKWDSIYGDGSSKQRGKKNRGYGFDLSIEDQKSSVKLIEQ
ncbi:hypothetical protein BC833DRAFT_574296 [Globomyces pollinis-pini]|nr:hypothetical protein BC833DRAFT_574296 [Globomyces pollinis-pini]